MVLPDSIRKQTYVTVIYRCQPFPVLSQVRFYSVDETGSVREVVLHGVVYHREFSENLLSIRRLAVDSGFKGSFGPDDKIR